ncbi:MAG: sodium:proton antiporter NhaD [Bacteroidales bacterium]|jgi:Na+/H+ antiporter NhaD/arsenite permease-like protein|nr:sodium:proton antiporter NhaD [Bacteroidales bacterium]
MFILMIIVFILGYVAIALEHPLKINKSATALLLGVTLWVLLISGGAQWLTDSAGFQQYLKGNANGTFTDWVTSHELLHHLGVISEILFFLLGAMTIVELIDAHEGFRMITERIKTTNKVKLLWLIGFITFFMSAVLDNLTTAIVMVALMRKLVSEKKERWFFAGMVIIAANSGGAFSPIGDITTIMLWIGGQVTTLNIILKTFIPSLLSMIVPLALVSVILRGNVSRPVTIPKEHGFNPTTPMERNFVFFLGVGALLFVPVFKTITHLPPWLGMLFGLGILWVATEIMHRSKNEENKPHLTVAGILRKVDTPSILFFLGILVAVAALQSAGHLSLLAQSLEKHIGNLYVINVIIGLLSSVVDNVPLVAGAIGMYGNTFGPDHYFWEMLAYCAGAGGSIFIIGSAAGVAVMGMEKIDFLWYLKKVSLPAFLGYLVGAVVYWGMKLLFFS